MSPRNLVIAIDGPAASGKSTTARLVAERLGYLHVDTGAMYRALTLKILRAGVPPGDQTRVGTIARLTHIELRKKDGSLCVILDGEDVTREIRAPEVTRAVSEISSHREVREVMVREQQAMGARGGIVLEGRDIGTVVFPDADLKFFVVANIETRAHRRAEELRAQGIQPDMAILINEIRERDTLDSTRAESPLKKADDAFELDTSDLTIDQQVTIVVTRARKMMAEEENLS